MPDLASAFFEFLATSGGWRVSLQRFWSVSLLVACFVWGRGPEKASIVTWIVFTSGTTLILYIAESFGVEAYRFGKFHPIMPLGGLVLLVANLLIAFAANRQYVLWVAAWQFVEVFGHVLRATSDTLNHVVYAVIVIGPGWMQLFIITGGFIAQMRREKGRYADWRWQVRGAAPARLVS